MIIFLLKFFLYFVLLYHFNNFMLFRNVRIEILTLCSLGMSCVGETEI